MVHGIAAIHLCGLPVSGQVLKQGRTPDALEEYYASPVAADGKIFLASAIGKVTVLKAARNGK